MIAFLQHVPAEATGTGLEWMPVASFLIPLVLLILIIWAGTKTTV